ncbi:MAG TPA: universal stress protein [Verrucomicrobiae bacterium]|nr:universal stress protein [Verrucomicrobiae bacterium]
MERRESELPPIALPSIQLKKILLPIDFSENSRKALAYAVSFARQFGAEVLLLHVIDVYPVAVQSGALPIGTCDNILDQSAEKLAEWREEFHSRATAQSLVRFGVAREEIVDVAREDRADLIIMGTRGRTGVAHLFGSTAEWVVRHAPCPVLVVREREQDFVQTPA